MKLRLGREFPGILTLIGLLAYLAIARPAFFTANNLRDLMLANVPVLVVATGMTLVIIIAEIDVSVGALFGVCSVIAGISALHLPMLLVPWIAIGTGAVLGALNGALIAWVRAPSIVVTLATMVAWREALRWSTGGAWIQNLPTNFQWFGLTQHGGEVLIFGSAMAIFFFFLGGMKHLVALRFVHAVGSSKEAARLAGIPVQWVIFGIFVLVGALTGTASILNAVRFADVPANSGINLELKAIAAVVVGGTPITGGRGSLLGTLVGVVLLGSIPPALIFLGVNPSWEKAVQGLIILAAVGIDVVGTSHWSRAPAE